MTAKGKAARLAYLAAALAYTAGLWIEAGPWWALGGLLVGVGLVALGRRQKRKRADLRPEDS